METLASAEFGALKVFAGKHDPSEYGGGIPGSVESPGGSVEEAILDAPNKDGAERIGVLYGKREIAAELLGAAKVEVVGEEGHCERDKGGAKGASKLVVLGLGPELFLGKRLLAHDGRFTSADGR